MTNYVLALLVVIGLGTTPTALAQSPLLLFNAGRALGRRTNQLASARPVTTQQYAARQYPLQRTPAAQLPKHEAELITAVESELENCRTALLASATEPVCSPEQLRAVRTALANLMRARLHWSTAAYAEELDFYLAEDTRRQQAANAAR